MDHLVVRCSLGRIALVSFDYFAGNSRVRGQGVCRSLGVKHVVGCSDELSSVRRAIYKEGKNWLDVEKECLTVRVAISGWR